MILPAAPLVALICVFGVLALACITYLVWHDDPETIKRPARAAFKLFLGIFAYPVTVLAIMATFILMMLFTIVLYTAHRVTGDHRNYRVKVSFE
jgi:hypothetical protein